MPTNGYFDIEGILGLSTNDLPIYVYRHSNSTKGRFVEVGFYRLLYIGLSRKESAYIDSLLPLGAK